MNMVNYIQVKCSIQYINDKTYLSFLFVNLNGFRYQASNNISKVLVNNMYKCFMIRGFVFRCMYKPIGSALFHVLVKCQGLHADYIMPCPVYRIR